MAVGALAAAALLVPVGQAGAAEPGAGSAGADADNSRYELVHGCYALRDRASGRYVAKTADGGYRASAASVGEAEPFRMQATELGKYLFYGREGDFMAIGTAPVALPGGGERIESAAQPSAAADWTVDNGDAGAFTIDMPGENKGVAAQGDDGTLVPSADPGQFEFEGTAGCATFPESEVNAEGEPATRPTDFGAVRGFVDAHIHMMAFEFLGGRVHCARPWHPYGVTAALVDCEDHGPGGSGAALENVISYKNPARFHDPVGWPTFKDWPAYRSLTHEQTYWKWLERAWRGGLRVYVNLLVDNAVLCELYPLKRNSCNEMDGVRLQMRRLRELENYIDAQYGGPGKGWFRIVSDPFEARRLISQGKLAVVPGIEVSKLFDCGRYNGEPDPGCNSEHIDRQLDAVYDMGVRDMELINKFDNALGGVAGDSGDTGVVTNAGNHYETGQFWDMQTCDPNSPEGAEDRTQTTAPGTERDALVGGVLQQVAPNQTLPAYSEPPHCNQFGLTDLGEHLVRRMMEKGMMIDPDHLSVAARNELLSIVESKRYSGVVSSHSWSTPDSIPRIYKLGGFVTPYAGASENFVETWMKYRPMRDKRFKFGFGYGADMNGFGAQGPPRGADVPNPVRYPFKSFDGKVTLDKQRTGERTWDINVDGVAHYGLYPDWIEDLRQLAGDQIVKDMAKGSEAYVEMWERAVGVPRRCFDSRVRIFGRGLGRSRIDVPTETHLRRAGQPRIRGSRAWHYCVKKRRRGPGRVSAVLSTEGIPRLFVSTAPRHRILRVTPGDRLRALPRSARPFGRGVRVRSAGRGRLYVYGVRAGKVRFVGVASRAISGSPAALKRYLRLAKVQ
jgi:hypothetical protein